MGLFEIKESVQEISEAIAAVLKVDVTIVDEKLRRVASTGEYKKDIGKKLPRNCSFENILLSKEPQFIQNPNISEHCINCTSKGRCIEVATLGYPIRDNDNLVGIIGIMAFNDEQAKRFHKEYDSLLIFINKLSDLLVNTMKDNAYIKKLNVNHSVTFDHIIGESEVILYAKNLAKSVAKSKSSISLRGESGTGKELFARAIHNYSFRKNAPFVAINCASIPENLLESELFGYDEGAFTGASKGGKIGKFELADNGTLFLDEIGDLPIHLQPKLLRVLQDESFTRLGSKNLISVDFRLITATNKNLEEMIKNGQFREDLYYRLNVIPIEIPPLRQRGNDIDKLSEYGLMKYLNKLGKRNIKFSEKVKELFRHHNWPGNIRELENVIEFLVNTVKNEVILPKDLPKNMINQYSISDYEILQKKFMTVEKTNTYDIDIDDQKTLEELMSLYEKEILKNYLNFYGSTLMSKEQIARKLDINIATLYRKLKKYNL